MLHLHTIANVPTDCQAQNEIIFAPLPTSAVLNRLGQMPDRRLDLKALYLLRTNIRSLLNARKEDQKTLAEWCGHDKSWINKFLNEGRGMQMQDLDRIATFFGLEAYQLFQPGISILTERRHSADRRGGRERRIGHAGRNLASLRTELDKLPHPQRAHGVSASARTASVVPESVQRILATAERQIAEIYAELRGQNAATGTHGAELPKRRRTVRRPTDPKGDA